jgi:hypothetical protein
VKESAKAIVIQRPYIVRLICPLCEHEHEFDYDEFCDIYGEPPEWDCECIVCEECGEDIQINGQDWS